MTKYPYSKKKKKKKTRPLRLYKYKSKSVERPDVLLVSPSLVLASRVQLCESGSGPEHQFLRVVYLDNGPVVKNGDNVKVQDCLDLVRNANDGTVGTGIEDCPVQL